jgi:hypothetical protein
VGLGLPKSQVKTEAVLARSERKVEGCGLQLV